MKALRILIIGLLFSLPAMAAVEDFGLYVRFTGTGVNDNDVLFTTTDLTKYDACMLHSTAGAVDVVGTLNTTYTTSAISLQDFGATTNDPVLVTVVGGMYGIPGKYARLRVLQNGAIAATATLLCWKM